MTDDLKTILVVDDTPENITLLSNLLKGLYRIKAALNGPKALEIASSHPTPELILLDIMMPEMDGFEVCRRLKADDATKDIPVIFLSAKSETESKVEAFDVGGVDYITKPFEQREVLARIETHLRLRCLQIKLQEQACQLERSNQDLEQFAYAISHDLQEPLRMVNSYLKLLENRFGENIDMTAKEFMDFAVDGSARMQSMIKDLLEYSRVGTRAAELEPTDAEEACETALANLHVAIADSGAEVETGALPVVEADPSQLARLFQNLVGNAIKYRDANRAPRVRVSAEEDEGTWTFSIEDNGIGIEPEYSERIFAIFQRLHQRDEYSGTGVGLAVCKRIVERHGGRIWVDSTPGEGSIFRFTLPVVLPAETSA